MTLRISDGSVIWAGGLTGSDLALRRGLRPGCALIAFFPWEDGVREAVLSCDGTLDDGDDSALAGGSTVLAALATL